MKNLKYILASIAIAGLSSCGNNSDSYDATGAFEATEILVSAEVNGKIMTFTPQEGDRIDAGAIVGYIDTTQLYLKKMQ